MDDRRTPERVFELEAAFERVEALLLRWDDRATSAEVFTGDPDTGSRERAAAAEESACTRRCMRDLRAALDGDAEAGTGSPTAASVRTGEADQ